MNSGYLLVAALILCASAPARSQAIYAEGDQPLITPTGLGVFATHRTRYETVAGRPRAGQVASEDALELRSTLFGTYGGSGWDVGAEVVDARAYDVQRGSAVGANDVNALELVQAYASLTLATPFGADDALRVRAGRFIVKLGSQRLVTSPDYRNTANGFTGVRADYDVGKDFSATAFYTYPQVRLPSDFEGVRSNHVRWDRESGDQVFYGAFLAKRKAFGSTSFDASYLNLAERDRPDQPGRNRHLHTADARLLRAPAVAKLDWEAEGGYQWGHVAASAVANAATLPVRAGYFHGTVGYLLHGSARPRVALIYDYASGDGRGRRFGTFDALFGGPRGDLGPGTTFGALNRANIDSPGVRAEVSPGKRLQGFATYRGVWLASRYDALDGVRDPTGASGRWAGTQLEGRVRYALIPQRLRLESNFALLFKGRFLKDAPNAVSRDDVERFIEANVFLSF